MKKDKNFYRHREIAKQNGISTTIFNERIKRGWTLEQSSTLPVGTRIQSSKKSTNKDVAIYKGDEFIIWGSVEEVAQKLGKSIKYVKFMCYPSYHERIEDSENSMYGIFIEDEE